VSGRIILLRNAGIRNDSENALPFFGLELLSCDFHRIRMNINRGALSFNPELDAGRNFELPWI
jgi:hypothetical protein